MDQKNTNTWDCFLEQWKMIHGWTLRETFRAILERATTSSIKEVERATTSSIKEEDSTLKILQIIIF
jgi:hypothetical protein